MSCSDIHILQRPARWYFCNDCSNEFQTRLLAQTSNKKPNRLQHFCSFYGKLITRKICLSSQFCKANHTEKYCIVPLLSNENKKNLIAKKAMMGMNKNSKIVSESDSDETFYDYTYDKTWMTRSKTKQLTKENTIDIDIEMYQCSNGFHRNFIQYSSSSSSTVKHVIKNRRRKRSKIREQLFNENLLWFKVEKHFFKIWRNDTFLVNFTYINIQGRICLKRISDSVIRFNRIRSAGIEQKPSLILTDDDICNLNENNDYISLCSEIICEQNIKEKLDIITIEDSEDVNKDNARALDNKEEDGEGKEDENENEWNLISMPNPSLSKLCDMGIEKFNKHMKRFEYNYKRKIKIVEFNEFIEEEKHNPKFKLSEIPQSAHKYLNALANQMTIASIGLTAFYEHCAIDIVEKCIQKKDTLL